MSTERPTAQSVADEINARGIGVSRRDAQRWRLVKAFHPLLRLEHWDGHGWGPLYGDEADKVIDDLILKAKP